MAKRMRFDDGHRAYYDHEGAYQKILAKGGAGWDDLSDGANTDSYTGVGEFLISQFADSLGPGQVVLEVGCGGGQVALMFAKRGCITYGLDFSPTAISIAKANAVTAGLPIEFTQGDCLTLDHYADASIDCVIDNHVWHCIVDPRDRRAFLRSIFRVLRKGGIFFSEMMTREGNFLASAVHADPLTFIAEAHNRYWAGREEALEEMQSAGFAILHERLKQQPDAPGVGDLLVMYCRR